jgi:hypothetical protein
LVAELVPQFVDDVEGPPAMGAFELAVFNQRHSGGLRSTDMIGVVHWDGKARVVSSGFHKTSPFNAVTTSLPEYFAQAAPIWTRSDAGASLFDVLAPNIGDVVPRATPCISDKAAR